MWEKLVQAIRDIVFLSEQSRRDTEEIKELRKRIEDLTLLVERLAFEIQRTREKLILRLEGKSAETTKEKPRRKNKK